MPVPDGHVPDGAPAGTARDAAPSVSLPAEAAALRDAEAIARRVAEDHALAAAERERLAVDGLPVLDDPALPARVLRPGERVHAVRAVAVIERREEATPIGGTLYLTSERLLHVSEAGVDGYPLERITDVAVAVERLLLIAFADGSDLAIELERPHLLRVQVARARADRRGREA